MWFCLVLHFFVLCMFFLWVYPPKIFLKLFFDRFCKYHDGRGLGKKWCLFDHLGDRKRITYYYIQEGWGLCILFSKSNKRKPEGGILRDRIFFGESETKYKKMQSETFQSWADWCRLQVFDVLEDFGSRVCWTCSFEIIWKHLRDWEGVEG